MGQKSPVPMLGTVRKNNRDKALYSQLYAAHDFWDLLITHTIFTGGFGKVRWGINYNLETFAIKEFRAFDAKYPPFSQMSAHEVALRQKKTKLTPDTKVLEEARLTQRLRDAIEAYCKPYDNPFEDQNNSLCQVRERIHPFVIHTMIELPAKDNVKKVHMVMSRESGDLFEAVRILPKRVLPALALSLAAQGFTELAAMHDAAKYIHLDIKLENVLFHHDGQFKLMDFGLAQDISAQDSFSVRSMYGTLHAPEMFATDNPHLPERRNLSSATDVFCLALTIVDAAGLKQQNPFVFTSGGNSAKKAWKRAADVQQEFKNFRQNLLDKKGKINIAAIRAGTKMGDYFFALAKNNPDLCKLLLEQALVPNPALRSPARIVARNIRRLLAEPKAPNFAELRAELRKIAESNEDILALKHAAHQAMAAPS